MKIFCSSILIGKSIFIGISQSCGPESHAFSVYTPLSRVFDLQTKIINHREKRLTLMIIKSQLKHSGLRFWALVILSFSILSVCVIDCRRERLRFLASTVSFTCKRIPDIDPRAKQRNIWSAPSIQVKEWWHVRVKSQKWFALPPSTVSLWEISISIFYALLITPLKHSIGPEEACSIPDEESLQHKRQPKFCRYSFTQRVSIKSKSFRRYFVRPLFFFFMRS